MTSVIHFRKTLVGPPAVSAATGIRVRTIDLPNDLAAWLALRGRAVAWLKPAVRAWTAEDFAAEMSGKPWWRAEWTWLAIAGELRLAGGSGDAGSEDPARRSSPAIEVVDLASTIVGSVTLAVRKGEAGEVPVVHWLLVDPRWRRRGIGRLLMAQLEQAVWDAGWREVQLETHANWAEAVAFYQSMGFEPV